MGTRFSIVHEFDADPATYWEIFWDEAFNADQYARMHCGRQLLLLRDEEAQRVRDQEIRPERDVPAVLRKILPKGALRYVEHGVFAKPAGPLDVRVQVPTLGERFQLHAVYRVDPLPAGRCRREFAGECSIKVPLVGGLGEKAVVDNMRETYETAARVQAEWIARRKG